jgi:hypothetical protein
MAIDYSIWAHFGRVGVYRGGCIVRSGAVTWSVYYRRRRRVALVGGFDATMNPMLGPLLAGKVITDSLRRGSGVFHHQKCGSQDTKEEKWPNLRGLSVPGGLFYLC